MKKVPLILFVISLVLSACATQQSSVSLIGFWKLTSYGPANAPMPAVANTAAGLTFKEDGTVAGNSGCNGFGGNYTVEGDKVTFKEIVSTLMACDDPRMAQEEVVHKVLADTVSYKIKGNILTLMNNDLVMVLKR